MPVIAIQRSRSLACLHVVAYRKLAEILIITFEFMCFWIQTRERLRVESLAGIQTLHYDCDEEFLVWNPGGKSGQWSKSKCLLSKATPWELVSSINTKQNQREEREGVKGDLFHSKYFRAFLEVVWGLSEPLENSGIVRQANANPSPVAVCLSVCWADNVDFFFLSYLLSCFLPFVSTM